MRDFYKTIYNETHNIVEEQPKDVLNPPKHIKGKKN